MLGLYIAIVVRRGSVFALDIPFALDGCILDKCGLTLSKGIVQDLASSYLA